MFLHFAILSIAMIWAFVPGIKSGPMATFGENCEAVETYINGLSDKYMKATHDLCAEHKDIKDEPGTHPQDWDYIRNASMKSLDIMYESKAVLPPKDKLTALFSETLKGCGKGPVCDDENRMVIGNCTRNAMAEGFMSMIGDEFIEKNMNNENCKLFKESTDGEIGERLDKHAKETMDGLILNRKAS